MRLALILPLMLLGCAGSRDVAGSAVHESFLSDKPAAAIASCISLGMSWAGLPAEMIADAGRTVITFRQAEQVFATATVIQGQPTVVDMRGAFGARIKRAVEECL